MAERGSGVAADDSAGSGPAVGEVLADLQISRAWLVDPASGREGPGEIVVSDGILEAVTWLEGAEAAGVDASGVVVAPGFIDLHTHLREPGNEDAETVATGLAAAAHGGWTAVCVMPNTTPALDGPGSLARLRMTVAANASPVEVLAFGAVSVGREGETLALLGELADAGVIGFSDDGAAVTTKLLRNALLYAGMLGLPVVDHAELPELTAGAEANDGLVAAVLGLKGWPAAAELACVQRDLAVLADVIADEPRARLHLTHLSTAGSLEAVRRAKAAGLPVTCDVTPHHLALTDEWIAGARRWAWEVPDGSGGPWADGAIVAAAYDSSLRVNPPLRTAADAAACLVAVADGTADAVATDHAPHRRVDKEVEFGLAANGIAGLETTLGTLLAAVDAGRLTLARAIAVLTTGPAAVLSSWPGVATRTAVAARSRGLVEGAPADLVVFDRSGTWRVDGATLRTKGRNTPLLGRDLSGRVLLTVARGRLAHEDAGE